MVQRTTRRKQVPFNERAAARSLFRDPSLPNENVAATEREPSEGSGSSRPVGREEGRHPVEAARKPLHRSSAFDCILGSRPALIRKRRSTLGVSPALNLIASAPEVQDTAPLLEQLWQGHHVTDENVSAVSLRRNEAIDALRRAKHYSPDCGLPGKPHHLSLAKALDTTRALSVGRVDDYGVRRELPLSSSLGWYTFPFFSRLDENDVLDQCGPGIVLYFKLLKALALMFLVMSAMTTPSLILYAINNVAEPVEKAYTKDLKSLQVLTYTTLGALGEPVPSCRRVSEGTEFSFRCPAGGTIRSIVAYYGQPYGSCTCPGYQQPKEVGTCYGIRTGGLQQQLLSDRLNFKGQSCLPDSSGQVYPCFLGSTRYENECCSLTLDAEGYPDLSALEIKINGACNSYTLPYIVNATCLGQSSCSFNVSINGSVFFPVSSLSSISLASNVCKSITGSTCVTNLAYGGLFTNCSDSSSNYLLFEGICFASVTNTTDTMSISTGIEHSNILYYASILDALSIALFLFGVWFIRKRQDQEEQAYDEHVCRARDYTIECYTIPTFKSHEELVSKIRIHFEETLSKETPIHYDEDVRIVDINVGTSCYQYIEAACERGNCARHVDRMIGKIISRIRLGTFAYDNWKDIYLLNNLKLAMYSYEKANEKCNQLQNVALKAVNRIYVTFESVEGVLRCLKAFSSHGILESFYQRKDHHMEGLVTRVKRTIDPTDINWENIGVPWWSRAIRILFTSLLTLCLLAVSYVMIFEALTLSEAIKGQTYNIACDTYKVTLNTNQVYMNAVDGNTITYLDVQYDHNWQYYNKTNFGSNGYLLCFCEQINYEFGTAAMRDYSFYNAVTGQYENWCRYLEYGDIKAQIASYGASFVIIAVNTLLLQFLRYLVSIERHPSASQEVFSVALKLSFAQYINTGLLSLIIYGDLTNIGVSNAFFGRAGGITFGVFTGTFTDFSSAWYAAVGASLLFTMCMYIFSDQAYIGVTILLKRLSQLWDQRTSPCKFVNRTITHTDLQVELDQLYIKVEFPFEGHISSLLTLVFVCMTYSATMPLMNIVCCASISVLYLVNKLYLLRFHSAPTAYSAMLPKVVTRLFYVAAIVHCCFGIWAFGNPAFSNPDFSHSDSTAVYSGGSYNQTFISSTHSWVQAVNLSERLGNRNSIPLLIILVLSVAISVISFIGENVFPQIWTYLTGGCFSSWEDYRNFQTDIPNFYESLPIDLIHHRLELGVVTGHLRDKYRERLGKLLNNEVCFPDKLMEGNELYKISTLNEYLHNFGLDSFYMRRCPPDDWLVSKEAKADLFYLQSLSYVRGDSLRASFLHLLQSTVNIARESFAFQGVSEDRIEEVLRYCSPVRTKAQKIRCRRINTFRWSNFNNDAQIGTLVYNGEELSGTSSFPPCC